MITIRNLEAGYGKLVVLHDVNLIFQPSHFTAILGPNGSGKSTLLKSIFGLTTIFNGSIRVGERELVGMATEKIVRQGISFVPQRQNVFTSLSIAENLKLATRLLDRTEQAQRLDEVHTLFPILSKRAGQPAGQLSGGERQMLAIAIGWLLRPRVMLLDEPSAGLSPRFAGEVFRVLQQMSQQGMTLVVVEQNARRVLEWCDQACVLREGRIVFEGSAEDCRSDEATIKHYLGVHTGAKV